MQTSKESSGIDKQGLWGWWHDELRSQSDLYEESIRKALDIPRRPPAGVNADTKTATYNGLGWRELAMVAAMVIGTVATVAMFTRNDNNAPTQSPAVAPTDAGYEVQFFDQDGNPVRLDRWQGSKADD